MIVIDDKIVSEDLLDENFVCDLNACKGACCVQGDSGAPLEEKELEILDSIYEKVKPYLTPQGISVLEKEKYTIDPEDGSVGTPLIENGPCAYIIYDEKGIAGCGIEKAYLDGKIKFQKPVSCHLYPVRITKHATFDAVNYERWSICKAACKNGNKLKVPVFRFVKAPLIRKYGEEFYSVLEAYYEQKA
ncbi:MAG TPA: DUF3109 family protein [Chitinophagales bacterium]